MPEKDNEIIMAWLNCEPKPMKRREFLVWLNQRQKLRSIALILEMLEKDDTKRETG